MSTLNVNELNAPADHNFEIKVDDGELLNIDGTLGLNPLSHFKLPVGTTAQRPSKENSLPSSMRKVTIRNLVS